MASETTRLNKYLASATDLSRRAADEAIDQGRVLVNGNPPQQGQQISVQDTVTLDGQPVVALQKNQTILLNKPVGFVVSRNGQGSKTVFDLLPQNLQHLQPIGRLDKNSSGLLLLTNDGQLAQTLTHPSFRKIKQYEVTLDKPLQPLHRQMIAEIGIQLEDGRSKLSLERLHDSSEKQWLVTMHEGRNRQIRRTFSALGYEVYQLHRIVFGNFRLPSDLKSGAYIPIEV